MAYEIGPNKAKYRI